MSYIIAKLELPSSVDFDPCIDLTIEDLVFKAQTQLDLINEGECDDDPTIKKDKPKLKRFIKKYTAHTKPR